MAHAYSPLIVDTDTGVVRFGFNQTATCNTVVQQGGETMDFVLDARTNLADSIRIRVWENLVRSIMVKRFDVMTGTCQPLR